MINWFKSLFKKQPKQEVSSLETDENRPVFKKCIYTSDKIIKQFPIYKGKLCVRFNSGTIDKYDVESELDPVTKQVFTYQNLNPKAKFWYVRTNMFINYDDYWIAKVLNLPECRSMYLTYTVNIEIVKNAIKCRDNLYDIARKQGHSVNSSLVENVWVEWDQNPYKYQDMTIDENIRVAEYKDIDY